MQRRVTFSLGRMHPSGWSQNLALMFRYTFHPIVSCFLLISFFRRMSMGRTFSGLQLPLRLTPRFLIHLFLNVLILPINEYLVYPSALQEVPGQILLTRYHHILSGVSLLYQELHPLGPMVLPVWQIAPTLALVLGSGHIPSLKNRSWKPRHS